MVNAQTLINRVKELFLEGFSTSQIGRQVGQTRSGVSGIIYRLRKRGELPEAGISLASKRRVEDAKLRKQLVVARPAPKEFFTKPDYNAPEVLGPHNNFPPGGTCRYTSDDVTKPNWRMCGQPGYPWCIYHREVVSAKPYPKEHAA